MHPPRELPHHGGIDVSAARPNTAERPVTADGPYTASKPNILFIFADDQRFDTIGALGNPAVHTPSLDRLVARGTAFTHAHIPSGTNAAICMPSRAMLHTGRSLFRLVESGQGIPADHRTLGETLRAHGYRSFGCGKWHNGKESYQRSFGEGDEIFFGGMADHWNVPAFHYDPTRAYDSVLYEIREPQKTNQVTERRCDHIHAGRHSTDIISDAAVRFLEDYDGKDPFFLYVSFLAPHDPRSMPREYLDMYDAAKVELPPNFMGGHPFDNGELLVRDELLAGFPRTPAETRRHIAEYYAMITHLDAGIGRILGALDRSGHAENTIVVFAADNGLAVGQHGLFGKQNCYEHSVRVPLIFAGPGIPRGETRSAYVYLHDLFPTLCELIGIDVPESVDGISFKKAFDHPALRHRETLYFAYRELHRAVKDDRYKLIEYVVGGRHVMTQLFDLYEDPWETRNLAGDPAYAGILVRLRGELVRHSHEWGDRRSKWGQVFWPAFDATPKDVPARP